MNLLHTIVSTKILNLAVVLLSCLCLHAQDSTTYLFVGTYTEGKPDKGIYVYVFNKATGNLTLACTGEQITNPSFLAISPTGEYIYACTDTKLKDDGSVSAFRFDAQAATLSFINKQSSGGDNPVYITIDKNNTTAICGNYGGGSVAVYPVNDDGSLKPLTQLIQFTGTSIKQERQEAAHIHATVFSPDFNYLFMPDLGSDKIRISKYSASDSLPLTLLPENDYIAAPGSGPRHFTFHPNNLFAYSIDELSGTVTAFNYQNGQINKFQTIFAYSKLQETYNSADIHISPDGLFLYASNRWENENNIAIFKVDTITGNLQFIAHQPTYGENPRNFTIDPSGQFLLVANQLSNSIIVFKRDKITGLLSKTTTEIQVPAPACLMMKTYVK